MTVYRMCKLLLMISAVTTFCLLPPSCCQDEEAYILNNDRCGVEGISSRIINGQQAHKHKFPWVVHLVLFNKTHRKFCTGSLITSRFVLTAAHCSRMAAINEIQVRYGNSNWREAQRMDALTYIRHKYFVNRHFQHDIMLIYLTHAVDLTKPNVGTVCIPLAPMDIDNAEAVVAGFGRTSMDPKSPGFKGSDSLMYTRQIIQTQEYCMNHKLLRDNEYNPNHHICLYSDGTDSCKGDSGGPVMVMAGQRWYLVGLVSYGFSCNLFGVPALATNMQTHIQWLIDIMRTAPQNINELLMEE